MPRADGVEEGGFARGQEVRFPREDGFLGDAVPHPAGGETGDAEREGLQEVLLAAVFVGNEAGEAAGGEGRFELERGFGIGIGCVGVGRREGVDIRDVEEFLEAVFEELPAVGADVVLGSFAGIGIFDVGDAEDDVVEEVGCVPWDGA